jgi:polyisoprenoid-binding protein YceI
VARYRIFPERARLEAEARSSLHPIRAETTGLQGWFEAELNDDRFDAKVPPSGRIELDVDRLKTGNPLYDMEIARRLESRKYPFVRGEVREIRELDSSGRYAVQGDLTLHGVTRPVEGEVRLRVADPRTVEIDGEMRLDMREFGLEPPRVLMLKVYPDVRVRGRVAAEREG